MLSKTTPNPTKMCCYETFEVHPIVAIYGLLWYINSIYGIILMIIESSNICFFKWCPVCIVNITIPMLWLIIIAMADSCCIKYWSLKKWNRRHYGASFLYFAILTNQLLIFGFLCFYGFTVWRSVASASCNASHHLYYGFILFISTSTILILWIGFYQLYAATKYLCTYSAVLDVKRRQQHANHNKSKHKVMFTKNGRKYSIESNSANNSAMSLTFIGSIFRYGSEADDYDGDNDDNDVHHDLKLDTSILPSSPPPVRPFQVSEVSLPDGAVITPFPSLRLEYQPSETEILMDTYDPQLMHICDDEKDLSDVSISESASPSAFNIEIAGIVIPTKKFRKKGRRKHQKKAYKAVTNHDCEGTIQVACIHMEDDTMEEKKYTKDDDDMEIKDREDIDSNDSNDYKKKHFFSLPFFGKALLITSQYFDRLKEDPSTTDLCIICYDSFAKGDYLARLKCLHVYHKNCIRMWLANNRHCPLCDMNEKNINLKFKIFQT